jgi:hypothetical protein
LDGAAGVRGGDTQTDFEEERGLMAQTKTKRSTTNRSTTKARTNSGGGSRRGQTTAARRAVKSREAESGGGLAETASKAGETLGQVGSRIKGPAVAGGAALAGLAAGVAISRNGHGKRKSLPSLGRRRKRISMPDLSMPKIGGGEATRKALGATAKALGNTAVEVGKAGYKVGELTSEVRRVREQAEK